MLYHVFCFELYSHFVSKIIPLVSETYTCSVTYSVYNLYVFVSCNWLVILECTFFFFWYTVGCSAIDDTLRTTLSTYTRMQHLNHHLSIKQTAHLAASSTR